MSRISDDELRQTLEAATPGPWQQGEMDTLAVHNWWYAPDDEVNAGPGYGSSAANAALIALAPALAAEVLQLRKLLGALDHMLESIGYSKESLARDGIAAALSTPSPVVAKEGE